MALSGWLVSEGDESLMECVTVDARVPCLTALVHYDMCVLICIIPFTPLHLCCDHALGQLI